MMDSFANEQQQQGHFIDVIVLIKEALRQNCWIYEPDTAIWYTPEEFGAKYQDSNFEQGWIEQFKIMNPVG
ncbi:hypothetical protein [Pedobacter cryoconitis]|uniref:hypothetical protein n=1 Tax=Pedobacter cryoconitis TaxID=188932 RepID=UPI001607A2A8|nr:hypothetical protein [Pedobacter cryoconitis]MBB5646525.1 hypothetical protein [Pedobacter cryoconitis]